MKKPKLSYIPFGENVEGKYFLDIPSKPHDVSWDFGLKDETVVLDVIVKAKNIDITFEDNFKKNKIKVLVSKLKKRKKSRYPTEFKRKQSKMKAEIGKCQLCSSPKYLQVHHKDRNKFNNVDENLILLCFDCHKAEHAHLKLPHFIAQYG